MSKTHLDATGLLCPLPVLKARKAMKRVKSGDILVVTTTDLAAATAFPISATRPGTSSSRTRRTAPCDASG